MNREAQDTLLLFVGVMVLQVGISDLHLRYVKPAMQVPLVVAGAVLTVLAVVSIVRSQRRARPTVATPSPSEHVPGGGLAADHHHEGEHAPDGAGEHGHDHAHMPRTAWLLALPLLVLTLVTPPSLGAYAAARGTQASIDAPDDALPPLPGEVRGAVPLTMTEYVTRSLYAPESLSGQRLRLTGFAIPQDDGGWAVGRVALSCCAADGRAIQVRVEGSPAPPTDAWVEVEGRFTDPVEDGSRRTARLDATAVTPVEPPEQQYE